MNFLVTLGFSVFGWAWAARTAETAGENGCPALIFHKNPTITEYQASPGLILVLKCPLILYCRLDVQYCAIILVEPHFLVNFSLSNFLFIENACSTYSVSRRHPIEANGVNGGGGGQL